MARLVINPTAANRRELSLSRDEILTIGRDPSNDLVLPDAMVSRRHAVIEQRGNQFFLRDCSSANGSIVNGDRVSERGLRDGDLVAIGSMRLLFREEPAAPGAKVVPHPSAAPLHCPDCGADYRRGDVFCRDCGAQVARPTGPPKSVCPSCGSAVPLPAKFCNACGAVLPEGERPPDEASPPGARTTEADGDVTPIGGLPPAARVGRSAARAPALCPEPSPVVRLLPETPPPARTRRPSSPPARRLAAPRTAPPPRRVAETVPGGFGRRLAAGMVDAVFVLSGQAVMLVPVGYYWWSRAPPQAPGDVSLMPIVVTVTLATLAALFGAFYHIYFWGVRGTTPGKELLDLQVESDDGRCPIGLGQATVRLVGYLLSAASLGVGFLMIAAGGDGLHDRIAGTRVVRRSGR